MIVLLASIAAATTLDAYFPPEPIPSAVAEALLIPAVLGPPAARYDQTTTTPGAGSALEVAVEEAIFGRRAAGLAAPDSLRRWGKVMLTLSSTGEPSESLQTFIADHAGLTALPYVVEQFVGPASASDLVAMFGSRSPDADRAAVCLDCTEEECRGVIVGLHRVVGFEPFERTRTTEGVARIPATVFTEEATYALYVADPSGEVTTHPLSGQGTFDIELPLEAGTGVYRVALTEHVKNVMPSSPFYFSLYVGVEPPTSWVPRTTPRHPDGDRATVLSAVNAERVSKGRGPLAPIESSHLDTVLAGTPDNTRRAYRYLRRRLSEDPAPGVPHGPWLAAFGAGVDAADAAGAALAHPVSRLILLDRSATGVVVGIDASDGVWFAAAPVLPAVEGGSVRDAAWATIASRWWSADPPVLHPELQAELDALAAEVVSSRWQTKKVDKALPRIAEGLGLNGYQAYMVQVPSGTDPKLDGFKPQEPFEQLAIGQAQGDAGDGVSATFLILLATTGQ